MVSSFGRSILGPCAQPTYNSSSQPTKEVAPFLGVVCPDNIEYRPNDATPDKVTVRHGVSDAELEKVLPSFDAVVVRSANRITRSMLVASPRVAIVGRAGSGVDNIDLQAASELGVPVVNAPTGNAGSVAG